MEVKVENLECALGALLKDPEFALVVHFALHLALLL